MYAILCYAKERHEIYIDKDLNKSFLHCYCNLGN